MANIVLNLCLEVEVSGLVLSWTGVAGTYYRAYPTQDSTPTAVNDSSVTLDKGDYRIIVWDGSPGASPSGWTTMPTSVDPQLSFKIDGVGSVTSAGEGVPWPPT